MTPTPCALICSLAIGLCGFMGNPGLNAAEPGRPNIDALAAEGTVFRQAYVAHPFCGPSRMALLSGRMPHCYGGQKNLPNTAVNLENYNEKGIPESETLISTVLQGAGYTSGCIGKWHLGDALPFQPNTPASLALTLNIL